VGQHSADVIQCRLAQLAVAVGGVEDVLPGFEQVLVEVHAASGLTVQRFGHERRRLAVAVGRHLGHVSDHLGHVAGAQQRHHRRLDLALPWPAHLMMMVLDLDPHALQVHDHFGAQVVELVLGRDGVVAAVARDQVAVTALLRAPVGLGRIDPVRSPVDLVLESDLVEDIELVFGAPAAVVGDAAFAHERLGPPGDVARIAREGLLGVRLVGRGDETQRGRFPERVAEGGRQVGQQHHVSRLDRLEPDRRSVEADAVAHQLFVELVGRDADVPPTPPQIAELQVDHLEAVLAHVRLGLLEG